MRQGRYAGTRGLLQNIWVQPTIAYKIKPNLSVAVGPVIAGMHILLEENILNPLVDGVTFGTNVAAQLLPGVPAAQAAASIGRLLPDGARAFRRHSDLLRARRRVFSGSTGRRVLAVRTNPRLLIT